MLLNEFLKSRIKVVLTYISISCKIQTDILPVKYNFIFSDLVIFYRIITHHVRINLPYYISGMEQQDVPLGFKKQWPMALIHCNINVGYFQKLNAFKIVNFSEV